MQKDLIHYRYLGALVLHQFGIVLLAQADNNNLRTEDVVGLGCLIHLGDETQPVCHHGIDLNTARTISIKLVGSQLNKIPS